MSDKQLAVLLRKYHEQASVICDELKSRLSKSEEFAEIRHGLVGPIKTVPLLDDLSEFVDGMDRDIEVLLGEKANA